MTEVELAERLVKAQQEIEHLKASVLKLQEENDRLREENEQLRDDEKHDILPSHANRFACGD